MSRRVLVILILGAISACSTTPAAPSTQGDAPVVGHWQLQSADMGEHLWIETDGSFTEGGGPPLTAGSLSQLVSSGSWTFESATLTLDDAQTGAHAFSASIQQGGDLLLEQGLGHQYRFTRE